MKRVLAIILCLLLSLGAIALVACDEGNENQDDSGNNNNNQNPAHVHTYKTDAEWTKDASGHWYDATCGCADAAVRKLAHVDDNKDAICDVCKYEYDHEHTYAEDWTADCTNHWKTADCGCIIAPSDLEAHKDENGDGECDVCKYVIEDLHEHYYDTKWTTDGEYHWHAALCEHNAEIKDKAAHEINAAGYCTVCGNKIKDVDKTDLGAILAAAVANNYKVVTGNVVAYETVYGAAQSVENAKTNKVYFILGNGDSFVTFESYDKTGEFIGVDQYWLETITEGEIFAVQIPYYKLNTGGLVAVRNDNLEMYPVSGADDKLNGYTYLPGAALSAYDDTNTLAITLSNLYDIMVNNDNVSNAESNYDAETGKYTFSFTFFTVNKVEGSTGMGGSGEDVKSYHVEYFDVDVEFTVNDDFVIDVATFTIESYRNLEGVDNDISYDPETNTVTFLPGANATSYKYEVAQTSGERTYSSIYPKASLVPQGFELGIGTPIVDSETLSVIGFKDVESFGDVITLTEKKYLRLALTNPYPVTSSFVFLDTSDVEITWVNNDPDSTGSMSTLSPTYNWQSQSIAFMPKDNGEYTLTVKIGEVTKSFKVVITEPTVNVPEDTANTKYVQVTDTFGWEDEYAFTATEAGTYTFTIPAGLGLWINDDAAPAVDPFDPNYLGQAVNYDVKLAAGETLSFAVGSESKGVYAIGVAFTAGDVGGDDEGGDVDYTTTIVIGGNTIYISPDEISAGTASRALTITEEGVYQFNGDLFVSGIVDANNTSIEKVDNKFTLVPGSYTVTFTMFSNFGITADTAYALTVINTTAGGGEGGDEPTTETLDATYYAYQEGQVIVTVDFNADGTVVITNVHPAMGSSLTANYTIQDGVVTLTDPETGDAVQAMAASITLTAGVPTSVVYNGWDYDLFAEGDAPVEEEPENIDITTGDNTIPVTGSDVMTNVTLTTEGAGVYYITVGTNAVVVEGGWMTYLAGETITIYASEAGETYEYEVNSEDYTEGTVNLNVVFVPKAADEADKDAVEGTHKVGDYTVELSREYGTGVYYATISNADYSVCLRFTYTLKDNGDNSYTLENLVNVPNQYNDAGADQIDTLVALDWTFSIDPMKEAFIGTYTTIDGYDVSIIKENGEYFITIASGWDTTFYFTYTVTDNGDGTITLNQTYVENINECGDKETHLSTMEALDITLVYDAEKEALAGTHDDLIDGYKVMFYKSEGVYYANVYTDDYSVDLYFTYTVEAGINGQKVITLTYNARPDFQTGTEDQANEIAATPIVIGGLAGEGTYESPFVIEEAGDYEAPYAGGYDFPYFQFTAPMDGYATITSTYANLNIQYGSNPDVPNNNMTEDGYANTVTVFLKEGTTIYFTVADNTFPSECDGVPFTATFVPFTSDDTSFLKGQWIGVQNMMGANPYTFNINADGTGSGSYVQMGQTTEFTINYTLVDGDTVIVNFTTSGLYAEEKNMTFTYNDETDTLEGDVTLKKGQFINLGSMQINGSAQNGEYTYLATETMILEIAVGGNVGSGTVSVTYSVNGEAAVTLTIFEKASVELAMGDVVVITIDVASSAYTSMTLSKVYPVGSEQNPGVIETLPYNIELSGNHDKYYTYTATEAIVLTVTAPAGCFVTNDKSVTGVEGVYTFTLAAGESVSLNVWTTSAEETDYTYTITGEAQASGGEDTGVDGEYLAVHSSGRKYKVVIDSAAGTITITRSDMTGNFTGGATTVTANYSFDGTTVTYDGTYAMEFDANGAPSKLTWGSQTVTEFVKQ